MVFDYAVNDSEKKVYLKHVKTSCEMCVKPTDNIRILSSSVEQFLYREHIYHLANERSQCIIEQGFLSYYHSPQNPFVFVSKVRMCLKDG